MTILITGAGGQLGRSLQRILTRNQVDHVSCSRSELDITLESSLAKILKVNPSIIINCAAYTDVNAAEQNQRAAEAVNVKGVKNMAKAANAIGARLLHISTDYVFSGEGNVPWGIHDLPNPKTVYGKTKHLGEKEIELIGDANMTVIRTAWLYGPFGSNFAKTIIKRITQSTDDIRVVTDQVGQPTSTIDLADAIFEVCTSRESPKTMHLANLGVASWNQFAQELAKMCGQSPDRIVPITSEDYPSLADRPKYSVLEVPDWEVKGTKLMKHWREALEVVFPEIFESVREGI